MKQLSRKETNSIANRRSAGAQKECKNEGNQNGENQARHLKMI